MKLIGGTPTSLDETGEQWDFPNAWAPLQSMIIVGLYATNYEPAITLSKELATRWLRSNYQGFINYKEMFEKVRSETYIYSSCTNLSIFKHLQSKI